MILRRSFQNNFGLATRECRNELLGISSWIVAVFSRGRDGVVLPILCQYHIVLNLSDQNNPPFLALLFGGIFFGMENGDYKLQITDYKLQMGIGVRYGYV